MRVFISAIVAAPLTISQLIAERAHESDYDTSHTQPFVPLRGPMKETVNRYSFLRSDRTPRVGLIFLTGIAVGATLTYLLEPRTRLRRQAILRDKALSLAHRSITAGNRLSRHLRNRLQGIIAITSDLVRPEGSDSDAKIAARVRSALGRATRHAHTITVEVREGQVSLKGPLAAHEAGGVIRVAERIRGVRRVENLLTPPMPEGTSPVQ